MRGEPAVFISKQAVVRYLLTLSPPLRSRIGIHPVITRGEMRGYSLLIDEVKVTEDRLEEAA